MILYADRKTDAIRDLLRITKAHRTKQIAYNKAHGIVPKSVKRAINESAYVFRAGSSGKPGLMPGKAAESGETNLAETLAELTREMLEAADRLEFERAAYLRDQIAELKGKGGGKRRRSSV